MSKRFDTMIFAALLLLAGLLGSAAASARGIDPVADSLSKAEIRAKMDSIHWHRPVVALVLSGGGAKGAAHVGAIRRIEELGIPVDMVLGTSMGGLMGGLFAMGYDSYAMEEILTTVDWDEMLFDRLQREYLTCDDMNYKSQYQLTVPFYYAKKDFIQKKEDQYAGSTHKYRPLSLEAEKGDKKQIRKDNMWESLPSGLTSGQKIGNMLSGVSVGYQDDMDFANLPVPFVCVATDLVSFKAKEWYEGNIATAMRSTMSIPGLFDPVWYDGMVLVDGGLKNNYPCDLARELGADIIIGSELSDQRKIYQEVHNIGDLAGQMLDLMISENLDKTRDMADVKIKPDLHEYNMLSFDPDNIRTIIDRGYATAVSKDSLLLAVKAQVGADTLVYQAEPAINIQHEKIQLGTIEINGVNSRERDLLMRKLNFEPGDSVDKAAIETCVDAIYATQTFDYVSYEVFGKEDPFHLSINCSKGPIHQVGLGLRIDSEEIVSALINLGLGARRLRGSKFSIIAKVCQNPMLKFHYTIDAPRIPTINATASVKYMDLNKMTFGDSRINLCYLNARGEFYFSNIKVSHFDFSVGARSDFYLVGANTLMTPFNDSTRLAALGIKPCVDIEQTKKEYINVFGSMRAETFDVNYFPTKGMTLGVNYFWNILSFCGEPSFNNFHQIAFDTKFVIPGGDVFAFMPSLWARWVFGTGGHDVPIAYMNVLGGSIAGRYFDQQIPFMGINYATPDVGNFLAVLRTDFRFKLVKNHYLTMVANYAQDGEKITNFVDYWGRFGCGIEYGYNTKIGPITANVHYNSRVDNFQARLQNFGAYVSIGLNF